MFSLAYFFFYLLLALSSQERTCDRRQPMYILNRGTGYFLGLENSEDTSPFLPPKDSISPDPPVCDAVLNYLYEKWCFTDDNFYKFSWPYRNDSPMTKIILDEEITCPDFHQKILKVVDKKAVVGEESDCSPAPLEEFWELRFNKNTYFFGIKSKAYMYKKWLTANSLFVLQDNGLGFETQDESDVLQQWSIQA